MRKHDIYIKFVTLNACRLYISTSLVSTYQYCIHSITFFVSFLFDSYPRGLCYFYIIKIWYVVIGLSMLRVFCHYLTKRSSNFSVCVYCNRSQMTSQRIKNENVRHETKLVEWCLFFTCCDVFYDLLQYTHREKCNIFVLYNKNSNGLLKEHEKIKTSQLT